MKRFLLFINSIISFCFLPYAAMAQGSQTVSNGNATKAIDFPGTGCVYNWVNNTTGIGLAASGRGDIPSFIAVNTGSSPVTATITATPVSSSFVYVANSGDNTVSVINVATNLVTATIPVGSKPLSLAVSSDGTRVYVANSGDNSISVISTATNKVTYTITDINSPYCVKVNPAFGLMYVSNYNTNSVTVINTATNNVVTTIPLGANPTTLCVSPDGTRVYVVDQFASFDIIDATTNKMINSFATPGTFNGITVSADGSKVYFADSGYDYIGAVSTSSNTFYNTVFFVDAPYDVVVSHDGNTAYVSMFNSGTVNVVDLFNNQVISQIPVGTQPQRLFLNSGGSLLYVANEASNNVSLINTATNKLIMNIPVGANPNSVDGFTPPGTGCTPVTYTITVNPAPPLTITAGTATGSISACAGTASASPYIQQFTVSANGLAGNITATASTDFEVSLTAGGGYGGSVSFSPSGGSVNGAIVYVRSAASAPAGNRSGNVLLSSPGAKSLTVAVAGTISALPTVNTPKDQTVPNGASTTAVNFTGTGKVFNWTNDTPAIGLAASGTGDIPAFTTVNTGSSPVTATITVVPVSNQYAYIANFNGNFVSVVNTATNTIIATVQVGSNPVGVSVSPDGKRVYVTNEQSNTVSVIDATNNTVITTIPVGKFPYGIAVSPDGQKVYVANDISYTVSVISTVTNTVTATIPLSTAACGVSISPDGSRIYVSNSIEPPGAVSVIDAASNMVITVIAVGAAPVGIISSPGGSKLYTANGGDNTVSVINTATAATTTITVGNNPWGIAISQDGGTVYVANIDDNTVSVINTATNVVIATIPVGDGPYYLTVSPDGTLLYVENTFGNSISVVNTTTNTVSSTIAGFSGPFSFGNFISVGSNCNGVSVKFKIIVNPAPPVIPTIIAGTVTGSISACLGTASLAPNVQQFNVSGSILTGDITVTATPGFEVSLTEANRYGNSVTLPQTGGTVNNTVVYARSAASATLGSISGNLLVSSAGAVSQSITVTGIITGPVAPSLSIAALPNGICAGTAVTFTATPTNGGAAPVYQWLLNGNDTGENSTTFTSSTLINGDIVKCIMTSNAACAAPSNVTSNSITVNVYPTPTVNAGGNKTIKAGSSILLNAMDSGDITDIIWSPSTGLNNNKILNPVASPASTTTYTITVQTANGCEAMDTATIEVQIPGLIIPNTFTPNGDGVNDTWDIKNLNAYANCTVQIFNRWGQNVYSSIGYGTPWDGTYKGSALPAGAYYYIINLKNGLGPLSGFVAMIR